MEDKTQPELFEEWDLVSQKLDKPAQVRCHIGNVAQRFAIAALGATFTPIRGDTEVCPDFFLGGLHGEIKSVGRSKRALIYKWRIEKEARIYPSASYLYVFVIHQCPVTCTDLREIVSRFRDGESRMIGCTLLDIERLVKPIPLRRFSIFTKDMREVRNGYTRSGYIDGGWQIGVNSIPVNSKPKTLNFEWMGKERSIDLWTTRRWNTATKNNNQQQ